MKKDPRPPQRPAPALGRRRLPGAVPVLPPHAWRAQLSPFLMLDYAGPAQFEPADTPRGVGEHPHRGFETVTIVYQGEVEHRDSPARGGEIGPGDVQWMTAAAGIVHEEFHSREFTRSGGTMRDGAALGEPAGGGQDAAPGYQNIAQRDDPGRAAARRCGHGARHRRRVRRPPRPGKHVHADRCVGRAAERGSPPRFDSPKATAWPGDPARHGAGQRPAGAREGSSSCSIARPGTSCRGQRRRDAAGARAASPSTSRSWATARS